MKGAKERLVEIIWKHRVDSDCGGWCADEILKEFVRIEDIRICDCMYQAVENHVEADKYCPDCNGLGWVAKGE